MHGLPEAIVVEIDNAKWQADPALPQGHLLLRPVRRTWKLDLEGNINVTRTGFEMVPDFAGTAHSFTGATLEAASMDLLSLMTHATLAQALAAYCSLSRVRTADTAIITQPFSPALFRQGPQPGPHLLMQFHRERWDAEQLRDAWRQTMRHQTEARAPQASDEMGVDDPEKDTLVHRGKRGHPLERLRFRCCMCREERRRSNKAIMSPRIHPIPRKVQ